MADVNQPAAAPQHSALANERSRWVHERLGRRLMTHMRGTLWFGPLMMPGATWLMWPYVDASGLMVWFGFGIVVSVLRFWAVAHNRRLIAQDRSAACVEHLARVRPLWVLSAAHWSAMSLLFFENTPLGIEFVLWTVLLGVATVAINSYAPDAQVLKRYLTALATCPILCLSMSLLGVIESTHSAVVLGSLLVSACLFYLACLSAGLRNHAFQREMLHLQFDNEQLIASLDQQTRQTQDAMASRSRLLAGAAHDLRQPVLALSLYADWLRGEPEMSNEIAPKIMESAAAINRLFDGLFGLAELDREMAPSSSQAINLNELLHSLALQYEAQARSRSLQLRLHVPASAIAWSHADTLRRIMGNLIDNAIKYTDQGGVLVACRRRADHWHLEVWDTGIGIAPDQLDQVFTEFYRATEHVGTQDSFGLGLAIVKRLALRVEAQVQVQSRKNRGSRFTLRIDATLPPGAQAKDPMAPSDRPAA